MLNTVPEKKPLLTRFPGILEYYYYYCIILYYYYYFVLLKRH